MAAALVDCRRQRADRRLTSRKADRHIEKRSFFLCRARFLASRSQARSRPAAAAAAATSRFIMTTRVRARERASARARVIHLDGLRVVRCAFDCCAPTRRRFGNAAIRQFGRRVAQDVAAAYRREFAASRPLARPPSFIQALATSKAARRRLDALARARAERASGAKMSRARASALARTRARGARNLICQPPSKIRVMWRLRGAERAARWRRCGR